MNPRGKDFTIPGKLAITVRTAAREAMSFLSARKKAKAPGVISVKSNQILVTTPPVPPAADSPVVENSFRLMKLDLKRMHYELNLVQPGVPTADLVLTVRIDKDYQIFDRENGEQKITFSIEFDYVNDVFSWPVVTVKGGDVDLELKAVPSESNGRLEVRSVEDALELVRRRRARRSGIYYQLYTAHQAHLWGLKNNDFSTASFSLCSVGWRFIELDEEIGADRIAWIRERVKVCSDGLKADPVTVNYARWYPSLGTVITQLLCSRGLVVEALKNSRAVLEQNHLLEESPMSGYNFSLHFAISAFITAALDDKDKLVEYADWGTLFKRITNCMEVRFGTMYEFQVIYDAMFVASRIYLVRRGHEDRRLKRVKIEELLEKTFRVNLSEGQVLKMRRALKRVRKAGDQSMVGP